MRGIRAGRLFGLEITIDLSWLIILALVVWTFSAAVFPSEVPGLSGRTHLLMGVVAAALFFASLLAHEIAHSLVAQSKGVGVEGITLFVFGGVSRMRDEAGSPRDEFLIAVVGPLTSLAIAAGLWAVHALGGIAGWGTAVLAVVRYLAVLNLVLAAFNLLPGFPLDGGRLFRALVWWWRGDLEEATRWASRGGQGMGMAIAAFGLLQLFAGNFVGGLWLGVIGWFLATAAETSYRQHVLRAGLEGMTAADVMTRDPRVVSPSLSVHRLVEEHFLREKHEAYPVVDGSGAPVGIVTLEAAGKVDRDRRSSVAVEDVMSPLDDAPAVRPGDALFEVIRDLGDAGPGRVLVVDDEGRLRGIVSARDVTTWLALRGGSASGRAALEA